MTLLHLGHCEPHYSLQDNFEYTFDFAFDDDASNEDVYDKTLKPMIDSVFVDQKRYTAMRLCQFQPHPQPESPCLRTDKQEQERPIP